VQHGGSPPAAEGGQSPAPPPPSTKKPAPLETSLVSGSSDLSKTTALHFLIIAYDHEGTDQFILDPGHDTGYLLQEFKQLSGVLVKSLSGGDATLKGINDTVTALWRDAAPKTILLLLLTGHGDNNAMELHGGERVDESDLNNLFHKLRQDSPKDLRVAIVFDICRENLEKTAAKMDRHVALVWSCSLGQKSFALNFDAFRMPSSFFLIGLFMASSDVRKDSGLFEEHLKSRVAQLSKYNCFLVHVRHCKALVHGEMSCPDAFEMQGGFAQDIDLLQSQVCSTRTLHA
jgi:hypothetical protein